MKTTVSIVLLVLFAAGCATNTINSRKQERAAAYEALTPEQRALVDRGEIKTGLTTNAVYIAWGKPTEIIHAESNGHATTTWIYSGTVWQESRYWNNRPTYYGGRYGSVQPFPAFGHERTPRTYAAAEVVFENGVVKSWRNITSPSGY